LCRLLSAFTPGSILLTLELTERELIKTGPQTDAQLQQLHDLGVRIAIDDFGTGHSSCPICRSWMWTN
jgi:EAL domain-containing protein (putative c-di-GMP-specific phosphodiesterase class I)